VRRRPKPDPDLVQLVIKGVGTVPARVRRALAGVADLEVGTNVPTGALDGREAVLIAATGIELDGSLEVGWQPGSLRFVRTGVQRREHVRTPVERPAVLVPEQLTGIWRAVTRDIGTGGTLVADVAGVPLGARMDVLLELGDDESAVRAEGRVIRAVGTSMRAVRFEALQAPDRLRLQRFIAVEQIRRISGD
jgi:hypothetical protein